MAGIPKNEPMMNPVQNPRERIAAAVAGEPFDMPVNYGDLSDTSKSNIVATRLAQNVGPLFGIPNPDGPFGQMSWLSDFFTLSLQEVGRGAPHPPQEVITEYGSDTKKSNRDFDIIGRYVYGKTPNEIAAATLNTYEPSTKAATVLAGINRLLEVQTSTLAETVRSDAFSELSFEHKLRAYGAMIFGVYRPQPLLVYTGWKARTVQRAFRSDFRPFVPPQYREKPFARCETPSVAAPNPGPKQPYDLELVDTTVNLLAPLLQTRRPEGATARIILDGLDRTLLKFNTVQWQEHYDPDSERRTVRATDSPVAISQLFAVTVRNLL